MFDGEAALLEHRRKNGSRDAVELIADINEYTKLCSPTERPRKDEDKPDLNWQRCLFDRNEHFIELSNMGEADRSLMFMVVSLVAGVTASFLLAMAWIMVKVPIFSSDWYFTLSLGGATALFPLCFFYFGWSTLVASTYFTYLRARYRFNRTTRKVYVLRPSRYGGNVVLDWDRVQTHVSWCAPREMTHDDLRDPVAREARQATGGGVFGMRGLVLYWPPFDREDRERKGEDVLWVGPKLAGANLWQYIRTFMEEGMDKVPEPLECEWLRKGYQSPGQHIEETALGPSRVLDRLGGRGENSAQTQVVFLMTAVWAPLHCLAERLCTWPTFPQEWNSDCGQRRREDGIGPEEPLRWEATGDIDSQVASNLSSASVGAPRAPHASSPEMNHRRVDRIDASPSNEERAHEQGPQDSRHSR